MLDLIDKTAEEARRKVAEANNAVALEAVRVEFLGRKGTVAALMKQMAKLPPEKKPEAGKKVNELKQQIAKLLTEHKAALADAGKTDTQAVDITLPGERPRLGSEHPINQTYNELIRISANLGFEVVRGPEVETEYYNFDALNVAPEHPARDAFDSLYIHDDVLLRTHTSPVQIRTMQSRKPPLRVVVPGKVFRSDTVDASHHYMFHNLEGLMVGEEFSMGDLKAVLHMFFQGLYGDNVRIRLRPSFFPFTEPSAEVDCSCPFCDAAGCNVCGQKGWMEMAGCGMVDPNVFEAVGYDPEKYTGFAFGMGVDRITMVKYGINDIRLLFENDIRFLRQF